MLFLTLHQMASRKKQTILLLLGIILGVACYVMFSGIMLGFREYIIDQLVNNSFHIKISAREEFVTKENLNGAFSNKNIFIRWIVAPSGRRGSDKIDNPAGWYDLLSKDPRVIGFARQVNIKALARKGNFSQTLQLVGCEPVNQMKVTNVEKHMTEGKFVDISGGGNRIILGLGVFKNLGVNIWDTIIVTTPEGKSAPFKIVGVFDADIKEINDVIAYALLDDVRKISGNPGAISNIIVKLKDYNIAKDIAITWQKFSSDQVISWDQANASIFSVFRIQDFVRTFTSLAIFIVAGFGIFNALNILISQKKIEIAILRSMGYTHYDIIQLFMLQGIILGLMGSIIGLILGYFGARYLETIPFMTPHTTKITNLMVSFDPGIYIYSFCLAFVISFVSSIFPALSAGKMSPIDILRSEARE